MLVRKSNLRFAYLSFLRKQESIFLLILHLDSRLRGNDNLDYISHKKLLSNISIKNINLMP